MSQKYNELIEKCSLEKWNPSQCLRGKKLQDIKITLTVQSDSDSFDDDYDVGDFLENSNINPTFKYTIKHKDLKNVTFLQG